MFEQLMKFVALHKPLVVITVVIGLVISGIIIDDRFDLKIGKNIVSFISGLSSGSGQNENIPSRESEPQVSPQVSLQLTPQVTLTAMKTTSPNLAPKATTIPATARIQQSRTDNPVPTPTIPENDTITTVMILLFVLVALIVSKTRG